MNNGVIRGIRNTFLYISIKYVVKNYFFQPEKIKNIQ